MAGAPFAHRRKGRAPGPPASRQVRWPLAGRDPAVPSLVARGLRILRVVSLVALGVVPAGAKERFYGPNLEAFPYPHPVHRFAFVSQGEALSMAYLDVAPEKPIGRTAVLLHGKNFCAATWEGTIAALSRAGYRVVAPDQIGFCKSTKPEGYQFSFHQLAANTRALLASLKIERATIVGHSTGGMLAVRYALAFPKHTERLVLVDPIGLEDWRAKGVPSRTVDEWTERERKTTPESMRAYQRATYYAGTWKDTYERWVDMYAGMFRGADAERMARVTARIDDMIFQQPVLYEFGALRVPTLLIIGEKDNTAIGKDLAPPAVRAAIGHYPDLGRAAAKAIPNASLVAFPDLGHAPQIQDPDRFHAALLGWLADH